MTLPPAQPALNAAGKAFFGSLCAGTFVLGCWQTQRLVEKQQLMKERTKQLAMEPMPYNEKHPFKEDSFQRLVIRGQFLHEHECLVGPRGPPPGALPDAPGSSAQGMSSAPQGYMVLTPMKLIHTDETNGSRWWNLWGRRSSSTREEEKEDASSLQKFVLINRGWVPRNLVVDDDRRSRRGGRQPAQSSSTKSMLYTWERPTGVVQVQAIPSKTEHPKFLVADHDLKSRPPRLYWFDAPTMKAAAQIPLSSPYVVAVQSNHNNSKHLSLPLQPSVDKIGEFKITPQVHAAYAMTWFGLSTAGMYMTRKLILRGR